MQTTNLIESLEFYIRNTVSEEDANAFIAHPKIQGFGISPLNIQMVAINTYLRLKLTVFSGRTGISVNDILFLIVEDTDYTNWYNLIVESVIPQCVKIGVCHQPPEATVSLVENT